MADTKISDLTAASTLTGIEEIPCSDGTATTKAATVQQIADFTFTDGDYVAFVVLDAAYTLTSTTSAQKIFNASTNGALTLATGWYLFDAVIGVTGMSATSGNAQFQLLGGGTATLGGVLYHQVGVDGSSGTAATQTGSWSVASNSAASISTAGTGTALLLNLRGSFEVTATGTIVPSLALVTAAAGSVVVGSYFRCQRVGASGANRTQGSWS
jgi:hypothetical protein